LQILNVQKLPTVDGLRSNGLGRSEVVRFSALLEPVTVAVAFVNGEAEAQKD
jgi:hypothetical protein